MYSLFLAVLLGIAPAAAPSDSRAAGDQFGRYWYQGKAELTRYELNQARYGELHTGEAVLISMNPFVRLEWVEPETIYGLAGSIGGRRVILVDCRM